MKTNIPLLACAAMAALITSASATVTMDWVTVGNANNDPSSTGYGAVDYEYKIGKYEVTNAQYGEFLNAKGQTNSGGIYNTGMAGYGITQTGSSGSFSYTVNGTLANRPVVYVSWFDAARFANWMMNGQGSSDMESGAYTLAGATSGIITANIGAQVYLPSENEWHKAAYYNAANASHSPFPNGQNTISTADMNYIYSVGSSTDVGTYISAPSAYGTFDQGGNVWEWTDSVIGSSRGISGGAWNSDAINLSIIYHYYIVPTSESYDLGFRIASVPEPTSMFMTIFAGGMMLIRRKRI